MTTLLLLAVASIIVPERWQIRPIAGEKLRAGYYAGDWIVRKRGETRKVKVAAGGWAYVVVEVGEKGTDGTTGTTGTDGTAGTATAAGQGVAFVSSVSGVSSSFWGACRR